MSHINAYAIIYIYISEKREKEKGEREEGGREKEREKLTKIFF